MTDKKAPPFSEPEPKTSTLSVNVVRRITREVAPPILRLVEGPEAPRDFSLLATEVVIGRSKEADICVDSSDLSRKHVALSLSQGQYTCRDLESRNGVYLNGVKVHSAVLRDGDNIQLGSIVFLYLEGRE